MDKQLKAFIDAIQGIANARGQGFSLMGVDLTLTVYEDARDPYVYFANETTGKTLYVNTNTGEINFLD